MSSNILDMSRLYVGIPNTMSTNAGLRCPFQAARIGKASGLATRRFGHSFARYWQVKRERAPRLFLFCPHGWIAVDESKKASTPRAATLLHVSADTILGVS